MIRRISGATLLGAAALLGACAQPQPARAPAIGNPQAMAAAQAAMGMQSADPANHPGKAVYDRACAACHNNPEATRSPSLDTLKAMRYQTISYALTKGKMQSQAAALSPRSARTSSTTWSAGKRPATNGSRSRCAPRAAASST